MSLETLPSPPLRNHPAAISVRGAPPSAVPSAPGWGEPTGVGRPVRQLSGRGVVGVWAAAALPMAAGSWLIAPRLADHLEPLGLVKALVLTLTAGLIWQFVLVMALVRREQGTLRWSAVAPALWLQAPRRPATGRTGGRLWLLAIPFLLAFAVESLALPGLPVPESRNLDLVLATSQARAWLHGNWGWYAVVLVMVVFNTVLGEELLFRGYLLPRMQRRFGRWAWLGNGVAFAAYHLHVPWVIPTALIDSVVLAYPSHRYRSAWLGIIVHSSQSVFFALVFLFLVLGQA